MISYKIINLIFEIYKKYLCHKFLNHTYILKERIKYSKNTFEYQII